MRSKIITGNFSRRLGRFLAQHPEFEEKVTTVMVNIVEGTNASQRSHALHGKLAGLYAVRISQSYRIVFALEPDAIVFIDIGSHDEVY